MPIQQSSLVSLFATALLKPFSFLAFYPFATFGLLFGPGTNLGYSLGCCAIAMTLFMTHVFVSDLIQIFTFCFISYPSSTFKHLKWKYKENSIYNLKMYTIWRHWVSLLSIVLKNSNLFRPSEVEFLVYVNQKNKTLCRILINFYLSSLIFEVKKSEIFYSEPRSTTSENGIYSDSQT